MPSKKNLDAKRARAAVARRALADRRSSGRGNSSPVSSPAPESSRPVTPTRNRQEPSSPGTPPSRTRTRPAPTTLRVDSCKRCTNSAIWRRSNGECYNTVGHGGRCFKCTSGHTCEPTPRALRPRIRRFMDLVRDPDSDPELVEHKRSKLRRLLNNSASPDQDEETDSEDESIDDSVMSIDPPDRVPGQERRRDDDDEPGSSSSGFSLGAILRAPFDLACFVF
ncbi:hypothetical protein Hte_011339 [Hypoxylon texense]